MTRCIVMFLDTSLFIWYTLIVGVILDSWDIWGLWTGFFVLGSLVHSVISSHVGWSQRCLG